MALRIVKYVGTLLATLVLLLLALIPLGWMMDDDPPDDSHIVTNEITHKWEQSLQLIALDRENVNCLSPECQDLSTQLSNAFEENWVVAKSQELVDDNSDLSEQTKDLLEVSSNQIDASLWPKEFNFYNAIRLQLLRSKVATEQANYQNALDELATAFELTHRLAAFGDPLLLSLAAAFRISAMEWVHELVSNYDLSSSALVELSNLVDELPRFGDPALTESYVHDYLALRAYAKESVPNGMQARLDYFSLSAGRFWQFLFPGNSEHANETFPGLSDEQIDFILASREARKELRREGIAATEIVRMLDGIAPDFFRAPNKDTNLHLRLTQEAQNASQLYCDELKLPITERLSGSYNDGLLSFLQPNGANLRDLSLRGMESYQRDYIERCMDDFFITAVKTVIALKRYSHDQQKPATTLTVLIPEYLDEMPIDAFTGNSIAFDSRNNLLYSHGTNFNDDGGSLNSLYNPVCYAQSHCRNNPTVSIPYIAQPRGQGHRYYADKR